LEHWLAHEPLQARPVRPEERLWRWCRRNPVVAGHVTAVALPLLVGTAIESYFAIEANNRAEEATREKSRADAKAAEALANARRADENLYAAH
jgi:hypothetical protein